jgi:1-acyl-sn-glycerol-3-phosphate acyltransferase
MSLLRFLVGFLIVALASTVFIVVALLLLPWRVARVYACNVYGKVVGRTITALAGVTPVVQHHERIGQSRPAIYISNHASTLDLFLGIWLCPMGGCGLMKKEIVRVPFFGWLALLSGHLLIDRNNHERAIQTLIDAGTFVREHRLSVWMLPEGTRSRDGRLLPFKKGFVHLAIAAGMPVVPVIVHGAHRNWQKGRLLSYTPMTLDIEVLEPIDTSGWKAEDAGRHAQEVYDLVAARVREDQRPLPAAAPSLATVA